MVFLPTLTFAGTLSVTATSVLTAASALTAGVVQDFFTNLFLNPGRSLVLTLIVCIVIAAPIVGLIFLIKKLFEKAFPKEP
jgi:hypothetical protein